MAIQLLSLIPLFATVHGATLGLGPRIVEGRLAEPGEIPYQVSIQLIETEHHFCGGSIIDQWHILTAAHCAMPFVDSKEDILVSVGVTDLEKSRSIYFVESIYVHEYYDPSDSWINDIALIKLQTPIEYSRLVAPVELMTNQTVEATSIAVVSGYGRLWFEGRNTPHLYVTELKITDRASCKRTYAKRGVHVHNTQICANDPTKITGACQGDSGGPLTVNGKLIGIVSWAVGCASTTFPSIFTRVPSYIDWIDEHIV
ncbi:PREDICTED: chymotrypsin-2-like [Vollenhovia emeryi]|uniref:chymotrypsin-2-like n=1 Tax=Vollenhovia emeryi TaxID=411798 RepID=UPI0005F3CA12|nr:PREDICTED: chymotrypsin-2-like [Vollenhovia emeryi]